MGDRSSRIEMWFRTSMSRSIKALSPVALAETSEGLAPWVEDQIAGEPQVRRSASQAQP
ncbi:MAG TPA: hypothetical protein PKA82_13695 [Pyrinomonadaceae bacterium]|nr:hypothetical protein [Pyrinomonadaceae bacterium]